MAGKILGKMGQPLWGLAQAGPQMPLSGVRSSLVALPPMHLVWSTPHPRQGRLWGAVPGDQECGPPLSSTDRLLSARFFSGPGCRPPT